MTSLPSSRPHLLKVSTTDQRQGPECQPKEHLRPTLGKQNLLLTSLCHHACYLSWTSLLCLLKHHLICQAPSCRKYVAHYRTWFLSLPLLLCNFQSSHMIWLQTQLSRKAQDSRVKLFPRKPFSCASCCSTCSYVSRYTDNIFWGAPPLPSHIVRYRKAPPDFYHKNLKMTFEIIV